jgi:hypothetical protein
MHLKASTKPHVLKKIHEFLINMAFTMAYPNFKKGLKMAFGLLGVNQKKIHHFGYPSTKLRMPKPKHILALKKYQNYMNYKKLHHMAFNKR